jgi:Ca-activated chloride channel homolog
MTSWAKQTTYLTLLLASCAGAQAPISTGGALMVPNGGQPVMNEFDQNRLFLWMIDDAEGQRKKVESLSDSVSKLDAKAPRAALREYAKGVGFLAQKNLDRALDSLAKSVALYPSFVAARNTLGSAYLDVGKNEQAEEEFAQAVSLDNHLPYSYLNLGRAQLALKKFSVAEESIQKASALAPLDLHLLTALMYAQLLNHDYSGVIATAHDVHGRKHDGAAMVHYLAAAAWQGQSNLQEAQNELQTFLKEDPKSSLAGTALDMIQKIKERQDHPPEAVTISYSTAPSDSSVPPEARARGIIQRFEQQRQLAEVESEPEMGCETCGVENPDGLSTPNASGTATPSRLPRGPGPYSLILRSSVNEVAVFFAATDHGKSVSDLTQENLVIRDDGQPPAAVVGFRNESQLPLRLGLVIDTSSSITREFAFEQKASTSFLRKTVTDKQDLAFVVGFSSAVLMVQDFTRDEGAISNAVNQLAPAGGTALWDAVKFASDKLANRPEPQPVARILVVISDGDDNCSTATLKQAIESAERNEVIVYTVSTREFAGETESVDVADRALKVLSSRTGGASFLPGSLSDLNRRLGDLQQVIRSRYLISYKPAHFEANGHYRSIAVEAQKSGHKLHVYARRGYYANNGPAN